MNLIDAVLGSRFRHGGDDRRLARLIVAANLFSTAAACLFVVLFLVIGWGRAFIPTTLCAGALFLASIWLLRSTGNLDVASLLLGMTVLVGILVGSWRQGGLQNSVALPGLAICVFAPLLLGSRFALVSLGATIAGLVMLYLAEIAGHPFPPMVQNSGAILCSQLVTVTFIGLFAWMHERSRRAALAARDLALASLEESGDARIALAENVDAAIFSVDRDLKLIAANSLFERQANQNQPLQPGQSVLDGASETQRADFRALFERAFRGEQFVVERRFERSAGDLECELRLTPIRRASGEIRGVTVLARNIREENRKRAELAALNRELADAAHLAGKAEVATDVLHNVGNVLAAVNGCANVVVERLRTSKVAFLGKAVSLLPAAPDELAEFLVADEKGRRIRRYLELLAEDLERDRAEMSLEMVTLNHQLDHIKSVVARQQAFARVGSVTEMVPPGEVIAEALRMQADSLEQSGFTVVTEIAELPALALDRHKLLEILTNFLANSRQALDASTGAEKRIVVRAFRNQLANLQIDVADSGIGISSADCERLFTYGFTTKLDGHGFGLASSLLSARSMGGTVRGRSDGLGRGATFSFELPFPTAPPRSQEPSK